MTSDESKKEWLKPLRMTSTHKNDSIESRETERLTRQNGHWQKESPSGMTCIRSPLHRTLKLQAHQEIAQAHYRTTDLQLKFTFKNAPFKKGVYLFNYFDSITVKKRGHFFQRKVFASIRPFVDPPRRQVKKETRQGLSLSEQWLKHSMSDCCSSKGGDPFKAQW